MRKLATVRVVDDVQPIEGADAIEVATVGGWKVVVKKGEFSAGALAIFFEIDSFLPDEPVFQFLRDKRTFDGREGYRLRTIKLRGQVSQGLLLPIEEFGQFGDIALVEGDDVSDYLNVVKWERPLPGQWAGKAKGNFPHFIRKTDEERIQNVSLRDLEKWQNEWFVETVKIDGSSLTAYATKDTITTYYDDGSVKDEDVEYTKTGVCSRNLELIETEGNAFWEQTRRYKLLERLTHLRETEGRSLAIQGELFGDGIQENRWKVEGKDFRVFSIWDIDKQKYLGFDEVMSVLTFLNSHLPNEPHIQTVQVLRVFHLADMGTTREDFLKRADEVFDSSKVPVEGLVYKTDGVRDQAISFKAISNKYLLKTGE